MGTLHGLGHLAQSFCAHTHPEATYNREWCERARLLVLLNTTAFTEAG